MREPRIAKPYACPQIRDHGRLSVLTAFDGGGLHFSLAAVAGSLPGGGGNPTPQPPAGVATPGPTQNVLDNTQSSATPTTPDVPDTPAVKGGSESSPQTNGVESGSNGGGGGVGSGGESLPFTGMAVGPVAALGAGLTAAGATLRRRTRRS